MRNLYRLHAQARAGLDDFEGIEYEAGESWLGEIDRRGSTYIAWVQGALNRVARAGLAIDGSMGPRTRNAVRAFQSSRGLLADGVVGPQTEQALVAAGAVPPPQQTTAMPPPGSVGPPATNGSPGTFIPIAVERPGGGRIADLRPPSPTDIVIVPPDGKPLHRLAAVAHAAMVAAARSAGLAAPLLSITSGYRDPVRQKQLWERALRKYGSPEAARRWVAPPGHSPHQTGRAVDLYLGVKGGSENVALQRRTTAYAWLVKNAVRFGFYPYPAEPWHWEYNPPMIAAPSPSIGHTGGTGTSGNQSGTTAASGFSPRALKLILDAEGLDQPSKWPGASSGITIGIGYDLAHVTPDQFAADWKGRLSPEQIARLSRIIGLSGTKARDVASQFRDITIRRDDANAVFVLRSLPRAIAATARAFPGIERLPSDAQGALVSLVFNRGGAMDGERRREMRAIRDAVPTGDLQTIATQIRSMKRLWAGRRLDGLIRRREAEAQLVESAIR